MRSPATVPTPTGEDLVATVRARTGATGEVATIDRRPNGFSTKAATELVRIELAGGPTYELFVKKASAAAGRRPDPPDAELRVYERLGDHPGFAAPRFFGTTGGADPWLVLAAVPGWDLRYRDLDDWAIAARALGRMQAAFHSDPEALGFLRERSAASFAAAAEHALAVAERAGTAAAAALQPVVAGYEGVARALAGLPRTLVHGDLAPKNVLLAADEAVFVDWEWAHVGPGVTDLADLVNGLDRTATEKLVAAYVEGARGSALPDGDAALPDGDAAIARALDLARLERLMFRIGRSAAWGVDAAAVRTWAHEAASLHAGL